MANLEVSGNFIITVGMGAGPQTWVVISVSEENGDPKHLDFLEPLREHNQPARLFVALSAKLGQTHIPLSIVGTQQALEEGFYILQVQVNPADVEGVGTLESMHPSALGIVVDDGTDRGQALACSCGAATVTAIEE